MGFAQGHFRVCDVKQRCASKKTKEKIKYQTIPVPLNYSDQEGGKKRKKKKKVEAVNTSIKREEDLLTGTVCSSPI